MRSGFPRAGRLKTYAPGQILVNIKSGMLWRFTRGFDGPNVVVNPRATSSEMYVVAAKNATVKKVKGWAHVNHQQTVRAVRTEAERTISELRVPSSTICVLRIALPSNAQKVAATTPAWIAVRTTRAVVPW